MKRSEKQAKTDLQNKGYSRANASNLNLGDDVAVLENKGDKKISNIEYQLEGSVRYGTIHTLPSPSQHQVEIIEKGSIAKISFYEIWKKQ